MCVKEDGNRVMIKGYEGDSLGKTLARANLLNK